MDRKKSLKIIVGIVSICAIIVVGILVYNKIIIPNQKYNNANALEEDGKYQEAISAFSKLDGYKDSKDKIEECKEAVEAKSMYEEAVELMEKEDYDEAIDLFQQLGDYSDSEDCIKECREAVEEEQEKFERAYDEAMEEIEYENYESAYNILKEFKDYYSAEEILSKIKWVPTFIQCEMNGDSENPCTFSFDYNESNYALAGMSRTYMDDYRDFDIDNGRVVSDGEKEFTYSYDGTITSEFNDISYTYNKYGNLISKIDHGDNDNEAAPDLKEDESHNFKGKNTNTYDEAGNLVQVDISYDDAKVTSYIEYEIIYDKYDFVDTEIIMNNIRLTAGDDMWEYNPKKTSFYIAEPKNDENTEPAETKGANGIRLSGGAQSILG